MYQKVWISGYRTDLFSYERRPHAFGRPKGYSVPRYRKGIKRRADNAARSRDSFRRLVASNLLGDNAPALCTLTFAREVTVDESYSALKRFVRCIEKLGFQGFKYISVIEYQKKGRIHFHLLIWGLPEYVAESERQLRNLQRLWQRGFVDCRKTDGSIKLASYMAKYLFKSMRDPRYGGERAYSASRNVLRPVLLKAASAAIYVEECLGVDNYPLQTREYQTEWLGRCLYQLFNTN